MSYKIYKKEQLLQNFISSTTRTYYTTNTQIKPAATTMTISNLTEF